MINCEVRIARSRLTYDLETVKQPARKGELFVRNGEATLRSATRNVAAQQPETWRPSNPNNPVAHAR